MALTEDTKRAINTWANVAQLAALVFFAGAMWANVAAIKEQFADHSGRPWHEAAGIEIARIQEQLKRSNDIQERILSAIEDQRDGR